MDQRPGLMDHQTTIDALQAELSRMVALAERTPADLQIPTCPGWTAGELWEHLGTVQRWATELVVSRTTERISRRDLEVGAPNDGIWAPWLAEGADGVLKALRDTSGEEAVWVWGSDPRTRWWARRILHETVVHDADAALALGDGFEVPPLVAADGICELLDNAPVRLSSPKAAVPTRAATVHLHATDPVPDTGTRTATNRALDEAGEWMISLGDSTVRYTQGHGKGDAAVRGPVNELMLLANRRLTPEAAAVDVLGDPEALTELLDALVAG